MSEGFLRMGSAGGVAGCRGGGSRDLEGVWAEGRGHSGGKGANPPIRRKCACPGEHLYKDILCNSLAPRGTASSSLARTQGSCKVVAVGRSRTGSPCPLPLAIPLVSGSATLGAGLAWVAEAEPGCGQAGASPTTRCYLCAPSPACRRTRAWGSPSQDRQVRGTCSETNPGFEVCLR